VKVIGLTGGIGSGKSTVARMFELLNVPVYYADQEAKRLMTDSANLKLGIVRLFGEMAYVNNELNRGYIADIVFKDKEKLKALNALVHPEVRKNFLHWVGAQNSPYVIQENPLIFEKNDQKSFDKVIIVTADKELRIQRIMERDGLSKEQVLDRMSNQLDDTKKSELADFVIYNETLEDTKVQVNLIHRQLLD
jgi:dephospho-CoA kinase